MGSSSGSGKGDKRRKSSDDKKYADGWDLIWGKKKKEDTQENNTKSKQI